MPHDTFAAHNAHCGRRPIPPATQRAAGHPPENDLTARKALWGGASTLSGPSRAQVEEVLERMRRLMNEVATRYGEAPTAYEGMMLASPGDASTLVRYLEDLARRQDAEQENLWNSLG
jgi:hypothetical protein